MATVHPNQIFPGFSCDGTEIRIPLAALPGLTSDEANGQSGNIAEVLRIFNEAAYNALQALSDTQKPTTIIWNKASPRGRDIDKIEQEYTWKFQLQINQTMLTIVSE